MPSITDTKNLHDGTNLGYTAKGTHIFHLNVFYYILYKAMVWACMGTKVVAATQAPVYICLLFVDIIKLIQIMYIIIVGITKMASLKIPICAI